VLVDQPVRTATAELDRAQTPCPTQNARDPPTRPCDRILHIGKGSWHLGRGREPVQKLTHEIAAAVIEPRNVLAICERVLRAVLRSRGPRRHRHLGQFEVEVGNQVGDRLNDAGGAVRLTLGLLTGRQTSEDKDRLKASLHAGDDVGVHAVTDHRRAL
jgi:hypothetical protein